MNIVKRVYRFFYRNYWRLYFYLHGKKCDRCDEYTETSYYEEHQLCFNCENEACGNCYYPNSDMEVELPNGGYVCADCYSGMIDDAYEYMSDR